MKKFLLMSVLFAVSAVCVFAAFKRSNILTLPTSYTGIVTNNGIIWTNAPTITNLLVAANASTTNTYVSNVVVQVPATSAVLSVTVVGTNANFTQALSFTVQKSYDNINWEALTNFVITGTATTSVSTNIAVTLNDYNFVRVAAITNANASAAFSRFEVIHK